MNYTLDRENLPASNYTHVSLTNVIIFCKEEGRIYHCGILYLKQRQNKTHQHISSKTKIVCPMWKENKTTVSYSWNVTVTWYTQWLYTHHLRPLRTACYFIYKVSFQCYFTTVGRNLKLLLLVSNEKYTELVLTYYTYQGWELSC